MGLEDDISPEDECRRSVLGFVAKGLAFLRTVDAAQADALRVGIVQDFDGVAIEEGDDRAGEVSGENGRGKHNGNQCGRKSQHPISARRLAPP